MLSRKECLSFDITLKLKKIHGRTHTSKIKKKRVYDSYLFEILYLKLIKAESYDLAIFACSKPSVLIQIH